jgi:hypothetical protein
LTFARRFQRSFVVGVAALATTACTTRMSDLCNAHGDPICFGPLLAVSIPATVVTEVVTYGPCELSDDPRLCRCRAARVVILPFALSIRFVSAVLSPGIWWTAINGGDWIGDDPWGLCAFECKPTKREKIEAPQPEEPPPTEPTPAEPSPGDDRAVPPRKSDKPPV